MFDSYIKENYKVVEYQVKIPSSREHDLTWKPYGYYKRSKAMIARRRCIALMSAQIIEAKAAMEKERKIRMEFDTDSFDILIDNCCSHTLTNDIKDYIEMRECEHTAHSAHGGTQGVLRRSPVSPVHKSSAAMDERASLRGEYEILLDGVSTAKSIDR